MFVAASILFINYVDRGTLSMAVPLLRDELHIDDNQTGILLSAFFWSYTLMQVPVGWLAERYGGHRVLAIGLGLWAMATVLTGLATSFAMLMLLRILLGFGESAGFPCMSKVLSENVPPEGLGVANGIIGFAYLFGPAVGSFLGGILMAKYGWRSAFFVFGAVSLFCLWPWLKLGRSMRAERSVKDPDSPSYVQILKTPAMWGTGLGLFSSNYMFYFMVLWLPSYLVREQGFSIEAMGTLNGIAFAINALAALAAGWLTDRYIARGGSSTFAYKFTMAVAHIGSAACMLCLALGSQWAAMAALYVYQALCGASSPGVYAISQILAGPKASGRWVGVQNTMGSLAGVVSPALSGLILQSTHHFTYVFLAAAVMALLGLVGWIWMLPTLSEFRWKKAALT